MKIFTAEEYLSKQDPTLGKLIKKVGPFTLQPEKLVSPYQSLVRSVVYQQLHGKAAATILKRLIDLYPNKKFPTPEDILATSSEKLRSVGLSENKMLAIKDIALKTKEKIVPITKIIEKLSDQEIIDRLTKIRGVGTWTVQMMLMFKLGRPDVMPSTDFGVQKGFALLYKKPHPKPKELNDYANRWKPYRSAASWYMWRAVEQLAKIKKKN